MRSSLIKKLLALMTLVLAQWTVITHANPNQLDADKTESVAPQGYESVNENPWLKSQLNPQTPDYPESVSIGAGNGQLREAPNALFIQN